MSLSLYNATVAGLQNELVAARWELEKQEAAIKRIEEELAAAEEAHKLAIFGMSEVELEELTTEFHYRLCDLDHDDRCGWTYDKDFQVGTKNRWLNRMKTAVMKHGKDAVEKALELHPILNEVQFGF